MGSNLLPPEPEPCITISSEKLLSAEHLLTAGTMLGVSPTDPTIIITMYIILMKKIEALLREVSKLPRITQ